MCTIFFLKISKIYISLLYSETYKMSYIKDKSVQFFHQKADTTDNLQWKYERNQRIIKSVAYYKKNRIKCRNVYSQNERVKNINS